MAGYIGTQPVPQATQTRDSFTATSGQTSFSTSGYTPNYLDVYLNGVKLAAADYTATNGSEVVLASGAATGDILEVVAYTTFTTADIPAGTPSIDDNGNATAITIDSSENVLVGKTTTALATAGITLGESGFGSFTRSGYEPLNVNRLSSDGAIAKFYKDGTEVGSIQSRGSTVTTLILDPRTNGVGISGTGNAIIPTSNAGAIGDANTSLSFGAAGYRFQDLYLSGGIYLGGTGSANHLDDYETGTFTPTLITGTVSTSYGFYTKIGNTVIARMEYGNFSDTTSNSNIEVNNLPFTSSSSSSSGATGSVFIRYSNRIPNATYVGNSGTRTVMWESSSGSYATLKHADLNSSTAFIYAQVIYEAI